MRIVFFTAGMPFNGDTIKTESLGGSETAAYYMAKEMAELGHEVFHFTTIGDDQSGTFDGVKYVPIGERNDDHPLGTIFMSYALNIPHDVLIAQRIPSFFSFQFNSKINIWWTHDIALKRTQGGSVGHLWNVDRVLGVSDFHKAQIKGVYGMDDRILDVLPNAVEIEKSKLDPDLKISSKTMIYSSRPERGLENLVGEGGIMEKLFEYDPEIKLIVCGYDNTMPEAEEFYHYLWTRCGQLPNVQNVGPLTKAQLYSYMKGAWLHIYPTAFEETSCITAMEAQTCGNPFVTTRTGALEETLKDAGVVWTTIEETTSEIIKLSKNPNQWRKLHKKALQKAEDYTWKSSSATLSNIIDSVLDEKTENKETVANHLVYMSDIVAARKYAETHDLTNVLDFISDKYGRILDDKDLKGFYEEVADYNTNEIGNFHSIGQYEHILSFPRINPIAGMLSKLPDGSEVLDYGCCVGHVTTAFAKVFPKLKFTGLDISEEQIKVGEKHAIENNIDNVHFVSEAPKGFFDAVVCLEVLEHQPDHMRFLAELEAYGKKTAQMMMSVPSGPMESVRWNEQQTREHIHHFELKDLHETLGHKKDFMCSYVPQKDKTIFGDAIGNLIFSWDKTDDLSIGMINYERKFREAVPKHQTLSVCMIVKSDGYSLAKCLSTIKGLASEIIVGIDSENAPQTKAWQIVEEFGGIPFQVESPLKVGFDTARNATIEKATKDWIMWIDDDETFQWPDRLMKYLRNNQYDALAISQHHFSAEPAGVIKTDLPCRVFRNNADIKFYGFVHEHPETEINKGAGNVFLLPQTEVAISHHGYDTEDTRRRRFERNFPLMVEDRKRFPDRHLGTFLWIRDLAHMNRFEYMQSHKVSDQMIARAEEAVKNWRKLMSDNQVRMVNDSLQYVGECVDLLMQDKSVDFEIGLGASSQGIGDKLNGSAVPTTRGKFMNEEDVLLYSKMMIEEKLNPLREKYI